MRLREGATGNPFADLRVRQAIALAIDRERLVMEQMAGEALVAPLPVSSFVFGFDPRVPAPGRDLEAARRLLAQTPYRAGFEADLDQRDMTGFYGNMVAAQLAPLGIGLSVRTLGETDFFERVSKRPSMYLLRFSCRIGDAQEFLDKWAHSRDDARGLGGSNYSYQISPLPGLDEEIEGARRELEPAARRLKLQAALRRISEAALLIPLLNGKTWRWCRRAWSGSRGRTASGTSPS